MNEILGKFIVKLSIYIKIAIKKANLGLKTLKK